MATLRALECLVAVLDFGSVTEAAARLHMSQPALSHQLAALEREIGTPVVERLPRGVRATAAGRAIVTDARAALAAAERVVTTGRAVAAGAQGQLRIACAESLTAGLLAPVLRGWWRRHPDVHVTLDEMSSADALSELVRAGTADLGIGPRPTHWDGHLEVIGREEIAAALAAADTAKPLTLNEIAAEPVVHYHPDNGLGAWLDDIAADRGVTLTAATRTKQANTAAQLAAAGLGTALVPTSALSATFPGVVRSLRPPIFRDVVCLTTTPNDPLVQRFQHEVRKRGVPVPAAIAAQLTPQR
ncbi:LysR family transcriptional regulator [Nocardia colli]|uniref:LysR family transcriptional regulator n=1 Tax=Nocardia colli TaxID=2545717 RepID=A0A5N0DTN8_9NOCA|nr:LysR family transcriptional regulator [Nocardia colli]KAA8880442.1 LysR family transcriptional regulator [Nocardia colli]